MDGGKGARQYTVWVSVTRQDIEALVERYICKAEARGLIPPTGAGRRFVGGALAPF